jgi:glycosyltransferase involved in cell wall biosynthesis
MKIAFLHMTMGLTSRGSEVVVDTLASELAQKHQVLVIQSGKAEKKSYSVKQVYPLSSAPSVAPKNMLEKLAFRLHLDEESGAVANFTYASLSLLNNFDPDVIVAVNGPLQLRILQGQGLKAKTVVFGHAGIGYHDRDNLKSKPDLFIALTPQSFDWARKLASSYTKVVYIPNPIRIVKSKKIKLHLPSPVILTVSALSKYKNVDKVLDVIQSLPYPWLLIGDGEERGIIEGKLSHLANDFRWLRFVDQDEIQSYYHSADVFCFIPDAQEAFGMVYLEAMAAGLPIVASDDQSRRQLIGEQGIYVDPSNEEAIIKGIQRATTLGKLDYSKELRAYSLTSVTAQIEKEFHDLI